MPHSSPPPLLSVVVVFYNMRREAQRTLYSLCKDYQQGVREEDYEVIAIDNGSPEPVAEADVVKFGAQFRYFYLQNPPPSPSYAVNFGVQQARATHVAIIIDGARMLTPGVLRHTLEIFKADPQSIVNVPGFHLGPEIQNLSIEKGYNKEVEDQLLEKIAWQKNGYDLFKISALVPSTRRTLLSTPVETNFLATSQEIYKSIGGFDEKFDIPGGGLVNLDTFARLCELAEPNLYTILGEGTFHQIHGGVASNSPKKEHPLKIYLAQYEALRGKKYSEPRKLVRFYGHIPAAFVPILFSVTNAMTGVDKNKPQKRSLWQRLANCFASR